MSGMILGVERRTAAEYSFVAVVLLMFAATSYPRCFRVHAKLR